MRDDLSRFHATLINILIKRFPMNLFATTFNYKEAIYYPVSEAAKAVPKVDFSGLKKP